MMFLFIITKNINKTGHVEMYKSQPRSTKKQKPAILMFLYYWIRLEKNFLSICSVCFNSKWHFLIARGWLTYISTCPALNVSVFFWRLISRNIPYEFQGDRTKGYACMMRK